MIVIRTLIMDKVSEELMTTLKSSEAYSKDAVRLSQSIGHHIFFIVMVEDWSNKIRTEELTDLLSNPNVVTSSYKNDDLILTVRASLIYVDSIRNKNHIINTIKYRLMDELMKNSKLKYLIFPLAFTDNIPKLEVEEKSSLPQIMKTHRIFSKVKDIFPIYLDSLEYMNIMMNVGKDLSMRVQSSIVHRHLPFTFVMVNPETNILNQFNEILVGRGSVTKFQYDSESGGVDDYYVITTTYSGLTEAMSMWERFILSEASRDIKRTIESIMSVYSIKEW